MPNNINEHDINMIRQMRRMQRKVCARLIEVFGENDEVTTKAIKLYKDIQDLCALVCKKGDVKNEANN